MVMKTEEIRALIQKPPADRYEYFIKRIADREELWGLFNDGWAMAGTDDDRTVFPVWPAEEYARLCADDYWAEFVPKPIPIYDFLNDSLPRFQENGLLIGVFPTPENNGVVVNVEDFARDLNSELSNY